MESVSAKNASVEWRSKWVSCVSENQMEINAPRDAATLGSCFLRTEKSFSNSFQNQNNKIVATVFFIMNQTDFRSSFLNNRIVFFLFPFSKLSTVFIWLWTERIFVWFTIERKTVTTIVFLSIWKQLEKDFFECAKTGQRKGMLRKTIP